MEAGPVLIMEYFEKVALFREPFMTAVNRGSWLN